MAEGEEFVEYKEEKREEEPKPKAKVHEHPKPLINFRLCELAKPKKNTLYTNYTLFHRVLPKEKIDNIGQILQEDLALTTEDAAKKMHCIRQQSIKRQKTKEEYKKAKKEIRELSRRKQRLLMKRCIKETLRTAIFNAYFSPPQIIMSDRMRKLSNIILKDLCKIMKLVIPDRKDESRRAKFLFAVSDYFAYVIETLYFDIQIKNIDNYEEIKKKEKEEEEERKKEAEKQKRRSSKV